VEPQSVFARFVNLRPREIAPAAQGFVALLVIVCSHAILETARDALLLTRLAAREWGAVYLAVALCALPISFAAGRGAQRFGQRRVLCASLLLGALVLVVLQFVRRSMGGVVGIYVAASLVSAVLIPQFWNLLGSYFTVAQGRRVFGPIASAGVVGAALGSWLAVALLETVRVHGLLLVSAGGLALAAFVLAVPLPSEKATVPVAPDPARLGGMGTLHGEPLLQSLAILVIGSTAASVTLDYFFKWSVGQSIPVHQVAPFVARYYAIVNAVTVVTQVFVGGALVRRIGVANAVGVTPFFLVCTGIGALVFGRGLTAVLIFKAADGILRSSVGRLASELVYLPVPTASRNRAKPFIDGVLMRVTQGIVGVLLLTLGGMGLVSARLLEASVFGFLVIWVVLAGATRGPYLEQLRRALSAGQIGAQPEADPFDLESAEVLVQHLSDDDPVVVIAAITVLARRGRQRLIPALILLHPDESVITTALGIIAVENRDDWVPLARRLLADRRNSVRMAAAHVLTLKGKLDAHDLSADLDPRVRGYALVLLALDSDAADTREVPAVAELLARRDEDAQELRLGALKAFADGAPNPSGAALLAELAGAARTTSDWVETVANAVAKQRALPLLDGVIASLSQRSSREAVFQALVRFGEAAEERIWETLHDPGLERYLRVQLPQALARFGTQKAADRLLELVHSDKDGMVRYRAIRALGRLVAVANVHVKRRRIEELTQENLVEYLRLRSLQTTFPNVGRNARASVEPLAGSEPSAITLELLIGLLGDKLEQSLERTFRLLKLVFPREDLHRVHRALVSSDKHARANAGEFLDTLLRRRDELMLRELLRIVADDSPEVARTARAAQLLAQIRVLSPDEALRELERDHDETVASLARLHAAALEGRVAKVSLGSGIRAPLVELETPSGIGHRIPSPA